MESERYSVVLSDPPWDHYGTPTKDAAAGKHYDLIPDERMLDLRIDAFLDKPGVLFLWATCPRLDFAIDCIASWGLHYRGVAFVWVKTRQDGVPIRAQGVRPGITKPLTELVLAASNVRRGRPLPLSNEAIVQTVFAPKREHSQKPDEVQERIELMYPGVKKLELFARRERPGWDSIGAELGTTI